MKNTLKTFLAIAFYFMACNAVATVTMFEQEPNNKPLEATLIKPPIKILANMQKSDQDLFLWDVTDAESLYLWDIQLQGITERLTKLDVMQIHFTKDGKGVSSFDKILTISSKNGLGKEKLEGLLFAPGKYYFGLSYGGSGKPSSGLLSAEALNGFDEQTTTDIRNQTKGKQAAVPSSYNLTFTRGKKLYSYNPKAKLSKENPVKVKANYITTSFYQEQPLWAKFSITEKETTLKWQLRGILSLGNKAQVKLYDANSRLLAETSPAKNGFYQFTDLSLAQGEYFIELTSNDKYFISTLIKQSIGEVVAGQETEPNDKFTFANFIKMGDSVTGRMSKGREYDYFKFTTDETLSANNFEIKLQNLNKKKIQLCLLRTNGRTWQCRTDKTDINLTHIALTQGTYGVYLRGDADAEYRLSINAKGKRNPIMEVEPNDAYKDASPLNAKNIIKGTFDANSEYDYFSFNVDKEPQLWTIQANGQGIEGIYIYNSAGNVIQNFRAVKGNKRVRLSNLFLLPGKHVIAIRGSNGKYLLRAFATGKPDKNFETEPNDDKSRSMFLPFRIVRKGVLQNKDDRDLYHFNLDNKQHIKLIITPPVDGSITYKIYKSGMQIGTKITKIGEPVSFEGIYPIGDYSIKLQAGKQTSVANYKIALQRLSVFDCAIDCEPNDSLFQAVTIPADGVIKGWANTHGDLDWYKLPAQEQESIVTIITNLKVNHSILIYDKNYKKFKTKWVSDETEANEPSKPDKLQVTIPANTESYYKIQSYDRAYDYRVVINGKQTKPTNPKSILEDITINIQGLPNDIKAFYDYGQNLKGTAVIDNKSSTAIKLSLKSHISHHLWQVKFAESTIQLEPQSNTSVAFTVNVPNDVFTNRSQMITIAAIDEDNNSVEDSFLISALSDVQAFNPEMYWQIPDKLLGGINVASFELGGKRTKEDIDRNTSAIGRGFDHLFNGRSVTGYGVLFRGGRKTKQDTVTVDLVGEESVKVIGFAINPLSENSANNYPKDIEMQLSTDGINFTSAVTSIVKPVGIEQYFVLDTPQTAKYARLIIYNNYENIVNGVLGLGEFKVIAQSDSLIDKKMNIASPKLGGNVIWAKPASNSSWDKSLITDKKEKTYIRAVDDTQWQWVIGFHHQRAALIESLEWQPPELSGKNKTFDKVQIMESTQSPVGPWSELTTVELSTTQATQIKLDKPTWARYLKFNVGNVEKRAYRYLPETIKVFEQIANTTYQSILGEWGDGSENAIYEKTFPHDFSKNKTTDNDNNSKQTAIDITQSQRAAGFVQLEQADKPDWYKFKLQQGQNTLVLEVKGEPTIRTVISLEDNKGEQIPAFNEKMNEDKINYTYKLTAEEYYYIKIIEPPRNVIFAWDTSGSTGAYHAIIFNALQQFSQGVMPGRDEVNFQPFGSPLLMEKWYGEPYLLKIILNNYPRNHDSSAAETYMYKSSQALENRKGSKAIIVITDAITSRDEKLWDSFKKVKPRVFSFGIVTGGGQDEWQTDLMQSWARVNHGLYQQVVTGSQVEVAFERAAAKLREPANYQIKIESRFEKIKGPGKLKITQDKSAQTGAIELILDASGSMLKKINGIRRINIAKEVLTKAVTEIIPQGTPVALRVFGNKQAGSCRTDLAIPLKPLDAKKANKIIQSINAKNLAKTPIAASLAKVASDLRANKGKKIVILVTDGEETCDGKPDEVIKSLIDSGVDIRLNIVGFAIDDEELKQQFQQWSSQGGGKYFDSNNSESLNNSVKQALQTPYSVYSLAGELVAESTIDGESIELLAGFYTIKIFGTKIQTINNYQIKGEENQMIEL